MDEMNVKWVEVNDLTGLGHGVEFYHDNYGIQHGQPIAFLEGYEWYHEKVDTVAVQILTPGAQIFKEGSIESKIIIEETKEAVVAFLKHTSLQKDGKLIGKIFARFNA